MRLSNALSGMALLAAMIASGTGRTADSRIDDLIVSQAWARPTAPVADTGAVYFSITNRGATSDRLVAISTPVSASAQMHESRMVDGMMRMREVGALECPPGVVKIEPGGLHVMLIGLKHPLTSSTEFPLTLRFEKAGVLTLKVRVGEPPGE